MAENLDVSYCTPALKGHAPQGPVAKSTPARRHASAPGAQDAVGADTQTTAHAAVVQLSRLAGNQATTALLARERTHVDRTRLVPAWPAPTARPLPIVQRFGETEHKGIGGLATGAQSIMLAPGLTVTHGDLVALGGDYFETFQQLYDLAKTPGITEGTRGEVLYALKVSIQGKDEKALMGKDFDAKAKDATKRRAMKLATGNIPHFPNPVAGDRNRSQAEKSARGTANHPLDAGGTYHAAHTSALRSAATLGQQGLPIDGAMAVEAFGEHFLTDSFSASHVRTERLSIHDYWHAKVPMFWLNFKGYMAEFIAQYIDAHGAWHQRAASVDFILTEPGYLGGRIPPGSRMQLETALAGQPEMTFGAVVAMAAHDYDGQRGVEARTGGQQVRLVGDGGLLADTGNTAVLNSAMGSGYTLIRIGGKPYLMHEPTMNAATAAVRLSVAEVREAYDLGKAGGTADAVAKQFEAGGVYAPESLIPTAVPDAELPEGDRRLRWEFPDVGALLNDPQMREALAVFARNKASMLSDALSTVSNKTAKEAVHVIENEMRGGPDRVTRLLGTIVNWTPDTGGGIAGRREDNNAVDYYQAALRSKALGTLTFDQKRRLIKHVISGATMGNEEGMIVDLLTANTHDALALINIFQWPRIYNKVGEDSGKRLVRSLGPTYWSTQGYAPKRQEVARLLAIDVRRFSRAAETVIVVLRTCAADEVRRMDKDLRGQIQKQLDGAEGDELDKLLSRH